MDLAAGVSVMRSLQRNMTPDDLLLLAVEPAGARRPVLLGEIREM